MDISPSDMDVAQLAAAIVLMWVTGALLGLGAYLAFRPRRQIVEQLPASDGEPGGQVPGVARLPTWGVGEVVGVFLLGLVPAVILQRVALSDDQIIRPAVVAIGVAYQSLAWAALGLIVVGRVRGDRVGRIGWCAPAPAATAATGLLGILGVFAAMVSGGLIMLGLLSLFMPVDEAIARLTHEEGLQQALMPSGPLTLGGTAALAVYILMVPIGEETLFRGMLYSSLRDRFGIAIAVLTSSVCFALLHLLPLHVLALFGIGFVLTILRERTGSLLAPIIAHTGLNAITILIWRLQIELPFSG